MKRNIVIEQIQKFKEEFSRNVSDFINPEEDTSCEAAEIFCNHFGDWYERNGNSVYFLCTDFEDSDGNDIEGDGIFAIWTFNKDGTVSESLPTNDKITRVYEIKNHDHTYFDDGEVNCVYDDIVDCYTELACFYGHERFWDTTEEYNDLIQEYATLGFYKGKVNPVKEDINPDDVTEEDERLLYYFSKNKSHYPVNYIKSIIEKHYKEGIWIIQAWDEFQWEYWREDIYAENYPEALAEFDKLCKELDDAHDNGEDVDDVVITLFVNDADSGENVAVGWYWTGRKDLNEAIDSDDLESTEISRGSVQEYDFGNYWYSMSSDEIKLLCDKINTLSIEELGYSTYRPAGDSLKKTAEFISTSNNELECNIAKFDDVIVIDIYDNNGEDISEFSFSLDVYKKYFNDILPLEKLPEVKD